MKCCISSSFSKLVLFLFLACPLFIQGSIGELICEELPTNICAYAIASSGKRCLLENNMKRGGKTEYQCRTSEVMVRGGLSGYIETDQCVNACGVDRNMVGISSDALFEPQFTTKLCSKPCFHNCPNILDLYFNLAAGEGVFLPDLCQKQRTNPHRAMVELMSSGAASGPVSSAAASPMSEDILADAPAPVLPDFGADAPMPVLPEFGADAPTPAIPEFGADAPTPVIPEFGADAPVPAGSSFDAAAFAPVSDPDFI